MFDEESDEGWEVVVDREGKKEENGMEKGKWMRAVVNERSSLSSHLLCVDHSHDIRTSNLLLFTL